MSKSQEGLSLPLRSESLCDTQVIDLKWNNVNVIKVENGPKIKSKVYNDQLGYQQLNGQHQYILNNVSGYCLRGQMTAILGPSGAGKTTLVALLSKRYKTQSNIQVSGEFLANNTVYDKYTDFGAFVMQDDLLMATLTVKETIQFAANLRFKGTQLEKNQKVNQLIKDMHLQQCQDTYVGDRMLKGISGGEKKRTAIGVELICDPPVIILDEPTSGLDSFTAFICMNILKNIAIKYQRTVLFTIHQPSADICELFNRIIVLNNGQVVFQGNADQIPNYCEQIKLQLKQYCNPLDIIMNDLNPKFNQKPVVTYENYAQFLEPNVNGFTSTQQGYLKRKTKSTFQQEFSYLFWRARINFIRYPAMLRTKIMAAIFLSCLIGTLFWNIGDTMPEQSPYINTYKSVQVYLQNMNGACFLSGTGTLFSALHPMMMLFPTERQIFLKEENTKMYSIFPYFLAKVIVELPSNMIISTAVALILYWCFDFIKNAISILQFVLITIVVSLSANGIGLFAGCLFPDSKRAAQLGPLVILPLQLFGGQLVNLQSLSKWVSWIQYLSPFKYFLEGFGRTQLNDVVFTVQLPTEQTQDIIPMDYYGRTFGLWNCIIVLFGIALLFHILGSIFLKLLVNKLNV